MATAKTLENELIVCPICFEIFQDPKSLPQCMHTFCKSCIKSYLLSSVKGKSRNKTDFNCPVCRNCYHVTNPDDWINNLPVFSSTYGEKMENKEQTCDYCKRQNKSQPAMSWCPECCDRLCANCVNFHHVNRLTMDHKVCDIAEKEEMCSLKIDMFCKKHSSRRLEIYCFDHEESCCLMCATVSHRKCENVRSLDESAQTCTADTGIRCVEMVTLQRTCQTEIARITSDCERLKRESKDGEHVVKSTTDQIIKLLKDEEQNFLDNLRKTEKEQAGRLGRTLDTYLDIKQKVEQFIQILQKSTQLHKGSLFLELKRMEKIVPELHSVVEKLQQSNQTSALEVHIDEAVQTFYSSFKKYGEIKIRKLRQLVWERSVPVEGSSSLTDVEVIDGRYIVTTCQNAKMVYILDKNGNLLSSLGLPGSPWAIAALQNQSFCISLRDPGRVCIIKILENLSVTILKELEMPRNAWGICAIGDKFVVSIKSQGKGQIFRFYDQELNYFERQVFQGASICGAILATSMRSLLFTYHDGNSLFSVDINNSKPATKLYHGNDMKSPIGLACDPEGYIYVACFGSNNVLQFNENLNVVGEIIQKDSAVQRPYGIRVRRLGEDMKFILTSGEKLLLNHFMQ